jgi:hypothetical protein
MISLDAAKSLEIAKGAKKVELTDKFNLFCAAGFLYNGNTFDFSIAVIENINLKLNCPLGMTDRFKFCDKGHKLVDFVNDAGFNAFKDAIFSDWDRTMLYYNEVKEEIDGCQTVAEVDSIIIVFT